MGGLEAAGKGRKGRREEEKCHFNETRTFNHHQAASTGGDRAHCITPLVSSIAAWCVVWLFLVYYQKNIGNFNNICTKVCTCNFE